MAQHVTLREAIVNLQFRLSQPTEGTLGRINYSRFSEQVDELKLVCNEAQRAAAIRCCTPTTALLRSHKQRIQVISGATTYALKDDYLSTDYVKYLNKIGEYPVKPRDMKGFPPTETSERTIGYNNNSNRYRYYDVYGQGSQEKLVGVVREASLNEVRDNYATFDGIRAGDFVYNITDGSQGAVTNVIPSETTLDDENILTKTAVYLKIDSLTGGKANRFLQGDQYVIASVEELNELMHIYPKIEFEETTTKIVSANSAVWSAQEAFTLNTLDVTINTIPDHIEDDDRLVIELLQGTTLASTDPASFRSKLGVTKGVNRVTFDEAVFQSGIRIEEDTDYTVRATVGSWELTINAVDVYAYGTSDYLLHSYSRIPIKMEHENAVCEVPPWGLDLFYAEAKKLAAMKITRTIAADPGLEAECQIEHKKIENLLWARAEPGTSYLEREHYQSDINDADRNFVAYTIGGT